ASLGDIVAFDRSDGVFADFLQESALAETVRSVAPDVIVNAAAHTAVDKAESEPELAHAINARGPAILAAEARRLNAWLIHYSTDYVFDGSGTHGRTETDATRPLN